jgi:hypothetical protein
LFCFFFFYFFSSKKTKYNIISNIEVNVQKTKTK